MNRDKMNKYMGITHCLPLFLCKPWKAMMCKRKIHIFDEVECSDGDHHLVCDACQLIVNIESIDNSYVEESEY